MSHYSLIATQFKQEHVDCLIAALTEIDHPIRSERWTPEQLQVSLDAPLPMRGYRGDVRPETAQIVVPRYHVQSAANDLGFAYDGQGGIRAIVSEYDSSRFGPRSQWFGQLTQRYARNVVMKTAPKGYRVQETRNQSGEVVITLTKSY